MNKEELEQKLAQLMDTVPECEGLIAADTEGKVIIGQTITELNHSKIAKTCATWQQTHPLTVDVIIDPQKKYTIRASEIGVCQLTDPESLCLLTNVRK